MSETKSGNSATDVDAGSENLEAIKQLEAEIKRLQNDIIFRTKVDKEEDERLSALIQQKRNMLVKLRTLKQTTNKCNLALEEISDEVDRLETQMNEVISSTQDNATKKKNFLSIKFQLADESNNGRVTFILDSLNVTYSMEQRRSATRLKELRRAMVKRVDDLLIAIEMMIVQLSQPASEVPDDEYRHIDDSRLTFALQESLDANGGRMCITPPSTGETKIEPNTGSNTTAPDDVHIDDARRNDQVILPAKLGVVVARERLTLFAKELSDDKNIIQLAVDKAMDFKDGEFIKSLTEDDMVKMGKELMGKFVGKTNRQERMKLETKRQVQPALNKDVNDEDLSLLAVLADSKGEVANSDAQLDALLHDHVDDALFAAAIQESIISNKGRLCLTPPSTESIKTTLKNTSTLSLACNDALDGVAHAIGDFETSILHHVALGRHMPTSFLNETKNQGETKNQDANEIFHFKKTIRSLKQIKYKLEDNTSNGTCQYVLDALNANFSLKERSQASELEARRRELSRYLNKVLEEVELKINLFEIDLGCLEHRVELEKVQQENPTNKSKVAHARKLFLDAEEADSLSEEELDKLEGNWKRLRIEFKIMNTTCVYCSNDLKACLSSCQKWNLKELERQENIIVERYVHHLTNGGSREATGEEGEDGDIMPLEDGCGIQ